MHQLPDHSSRIICSDLGHSDPFRVEVAPGKLSFGNTIIGGSSIARQLVVTNVGPNPVRIGEIKASGSYNLSHNAPTWLNPRQNFIIDVYFQPKAEGIHKGGVYVDTNGAKGTEYANLIGYGYVAGSDPNDGESAGGGVLPRYFTFRGDGETTSFPLNGADAYDKLLFDTYLEGTPGGDDFYGVNPIGYTIDPPVNGTVAMIRFTKVPADGVNGFAVLRGYAKPYLGPPPLETVAPDVDYTIIENNTVIDRTKQNALLVVNSGASLTILIRKQRGDDTKDWQNGEFFSVMQHGEGRVTLAVEDAAGSLFPAMSFLPSTRGKECIISATCINADADQWAISGDLLRGDSGTERLTISLTDRSVLIGSQHTVGAGKDSFVVPFGMKLDPIIDNGLFASLMTAQSDGNIFTADILRNGSSILNTKIVINNNAKTTIGAVTPPAYVANGNVLVAGDELTLSITQVGNGTARGLRVNITGTRT